VLKSKPRGYWRLAEIGGNTAADISGNHLDAHYEGGVAHYLPGPTGKGLSAGGQESRSAHLAGGRVQANLPGVDDVYSVEFWFWNGLPNDARAVTGYLFSRSSNDDDNARGDQLAIIGGKSGAAYLLFSNSVGRNATLAGRTAIELRTWNHVVVVRDGHQVRAYLNGKAEPGINGGSPPDLRAAGNKWSFGGRNDGSFGLEGKLSEVAIYNRALTPEEIANHFKTADVPVSK
jgi:hypothetical protein